MKMFYRVPGTFGGEDIGGRTQTWKMADVPENAPERKF